MCMGAIFISAGKGDNVMEIGKKLRNARTRSGFTQEKAAEEIGVARQTISNWENEKSYPDIVSVIRLSTLYSVSLDELLKGDEEMIDHLEESTNIVNSNKKLIAAVAANMILLIVLIIFSGVIPNNRYFLVGIFVLALSGSATLLYQIIRKI